MAYFTIHEASTMLGKHPDLILKMIRSDEIKHCKLPPHNIILISQAEIQRVIQHNYHQITEGE
jgi:hypothetical protein